MHFEFCHFRLNFSRLSLRLKFWYKVHLMMHYECASFEIFWILVTIIFKKVFTFPPRKWFAPNIFLETMLCHRQRGRQKCASPPARNSGTAVQCKNLPSFQLGKSFQVCIIHGSSYVYIHALLYTTLLHMRSLFSALYIYYTDVVPNCSSNL